MRSASIVEALARADRRQRALMRPEHDGVAQKLVGIAQTGGHDHVAGAIGRRRRDHGPHDHVRRIDLQRLAGERVRLGVGTDAWSLELLVRSRRVVERSADVSGGTRLRQWRLRVVGGHRALRRQHRLIESRIGIRLQPARSGGSRCKFAGPSSRRARRRRGAGPGCAANIRGTRSATSGAVAPAEIARQRLARSGRASAARSLRRTSTRAPNQMSAPRPMFSTMPAIGAGTRNRAKISSRRQLRRIEVIHLGRRQRPRRRLQTLLQHQRPVPVLAAAEARLNLLFEPADGRLGQRLLGLQDHARPLAGEKRLIAALLQFGVGVDVSAFACNGDRP